MDPIKRWLATSPLGSIVKVLLGTVLAYVAAELPNWQGAMPVIAFIVVQALVPVLINYLNTDDPRYGRTAAPAVNIDAADAEIRVNRDYVPDLVDADPDPADVRDRDEDAAS